MKNKRGWVPAAYLEPMDGPDESEEQEPNYTGEMSGVTRVSPRAQPACSSLRGWCAARQRSGNPRRAGPPGREVLL